MTLNISLFNDYVILSDKFQYILGKKVSDRIVYEGFYPKLEDLLNSFLDKQIRALNCTSVEELKKEVKQLHAELHKALQGTNIRVVEVKE